MNAPTRYLSIMRPAAIIVLLLSLTAQAQEIHFMASPEQAMQDYAAADPQVIGLCVDTVQIDTIYMEQGDAREMEMMVQKYPLARWEFYMDGTVFRRIDIEQEHVPEEVLDPEESKKHQTILLSQTKDIPNGAYQEFFPNGSIRVMGTLAGADAEGRPRKTGRWREWAVDRTVLRDEVFP